MTLIAPGATRARVRRATSLALSFALSLLAAHALPVPSAQAQQAAADSPLVKLLKSGRVPDERLATILNMIGQRGSAADLDYVFRRVLEPEGFPAPSRIKALESLALAAQTRQARPPGDLAALGTLITAADAAPELRLAATRLAAQWKVESLAGPLAELGGSSAAAPEVRRAALEALAALGPASLAAIEALTTPDRPADARALAVAALARLDAKAAATQAASVLREALAPADRAAVVGALLAQKDGPAALGSALAANPLPADLAKLTLRSVYAAGRSDADLVAPLSAAAGIDAEPKPLSPEEMTQLVADVAAHGDAARGEEIFRREELNCTKCHALSKAGGDVGPELSAIGTSSPIDYLANSILLPDQGVKEEYQVLTVSTVDGQVYQGIVADRDGNRIVLKEATGDRRTVATADIEESKVGGSLMPKGLSNFLTRDEFLDLLRFLSELGKPGPYAIRSVPTIQRWRALQSIPDPLKSPVPDPSALKTVVLANDPARWAPAYARVGGELPLAPLFTATGGDRFLFVQGEIDASAGGPVVLRLNDPSGLYGWLDDRPLEMGGQEIQVPLAPGRHKLTFRVSAGRLSTAPTLSVEVVRPEGSAAAFTVVGGP